MRAGRRAGRGVNLWVRRGTPRGWQGGRRGAGGGGSPEEGQMLWGWRPPGCGAGKGGDADAGPGGRGGKEGIQIAYFVGFF